MKLVLIYITLLFIEAIYWLCFAIVIAEIISLKG